MANRQLKRIVQSLIIATIIILCIEIIFNIPSVKDFFINLVGTSNGWVVYLIIWILMFLQTNIINIPAVALLEASILCGIETISVLYIAVVLSAYMVGCIFSYWLGNKFGAKAIEWMACGKEESNKWSNVINEKGKWWYALTVILPIFPDDILCLVAGAVKFDFKFYLFANLIGRGVGLMTMLYTLKLVGHIGGNFPTMLVIWVIALLVEVVCLILINRGKYGENN